MSIKKYLLPLALTIPLSSCASSQEKDNTIQYGRTSVNETEKIKIDNSYTKIIPEILSLPVINPEPLEKSLEGKIIVLDFWATWCAPCIRSLPKVENLWQKYKDKNVIVIGICETTPDTIGYNEDFIKKRNLSFPILLADKKVFEYYNVKNIPYYILIKNKERDEKNNIDDIESNLEKKK